MALQSLIQSPQTLEDAEQVVNLLLHNLARNQETVSYSVRTWDQYGCHLFAQALKGCHFYSHHNLLGQGLRGLANAAIMRGHQLATKS